MGSMIPSSSCMASEVRPALWPRITRPAASQRSILQV